jgi:hypothetical protein
MRIESSTADSAKTVDLTCAKTDRACERMTSEASWERLTPFSHEQLRRETVLPSAVIVKRARPDIPQPHRAVRRYARKMVE